VIHCFVGTKAQLIKMAPVMVELRRRGVAFRYVDSGQHAELSRSLRRAFALPEPDLMLAGAGDIVSIPHAFGWYLGQSLAYALRTRWLRDKVFPGGGLCLVHGDTLSTLLGLRMARRAGLSVGHVEAGLRSFRRFDPFPEEFIRVHCMKRADLLFAPSDAAARNLDRMKVRGRVIRVDGNTVADALRLMDGVPVSVGVPDGPFALATCHRLETLTRKRRLRQVVSLLNRAAERLPVLFVTHRPTDDRLRRYGLAKRLRPEVQRVGLLDYPDFVATLKAATCVLTDGGSVQEECGYLGKPCLILRATTERPDGVGANAALWGFSDAVADAFLTRAMAAGRAEPVELPSPSAQIVDALLETRFAEAAQ